MGQKSLFLDRFSPILAYNGPRVQIGPKSSPKVTVQHGHERVDVQHSSLTSLKDLFKLSDR